MGILSGMSKGTTEPKPLPSYLTVAGESLRDPQLCVEVVTQSGYLNRTDHTETVATCKACGESHTVEWGWSDEGGRLSTPRAQEWAKDHAAECRAMPKPADTRKGG